MSSKDRENEVKQFIDGMFGTALYRKVIITLIALTIAITLLIKIF